MIGLLNGLYQFLGYLASLGSVFFASLGNLLADVVIKVVGESLPFVYSLLASIAVPSALMHFSWPTVPGQVWAFLSAIGFPQYLAILGAAFSIKFTMRLIPFIFS